MGKRIHFSSKVYCGLCTLELLVFLVLHVGFVSGCSNGTIRLVGGQSSYEGRVEICINAVWGSVCHNSWGSSDARVVCRQLGLPYTGSVYKVLL